MLKGGMVSDKMSIIDNRFLGPALYPYLLSLDAKVTIKEE
jgi:hypothetical protein